MHVLRHGPDSNTLSHPNFELRDNGKVQTSAPRSMIYVCRRIIGVTGLHNNGKLAALRPCRSGCNRELQAV